MAADHLRKRGRVWYATYFDADGYRYERSTGCTSKEAARAVLQRWEREAAAPDHSTTTLNDVLDLFIEDRRATLASKGSKRTVRFYEGTAGNLVRHFGHDYRIARFRDSSGIWKYVDAERKLGVKDALLRQDLLTLRGALRLAMERGLWAGNPDVVVPEALRTAKYDAKTRSPSRGDVLTLIPFLSPNTAAAVAYILATTAETSALARARRSDIPENLDHPGLRIPIRGTKNRYRDRRVPIVTDEQRALLAYAARHAEGDGDHLFASLQNFKRDLRLAAKDAHIEHLSPHDLRRASGQWLIDLGMRLEFVSRIMGHCSTRITELVYCKVKDADLADRMLDAIDPRYASRAAAARGEALIVETIQDVPKPKSGVVLYGVQGTERTLTEWARSAGIPKTTLHNRVVTKGLTMAAAIALGRGGHGRPLPTEKDAESPVRDCRTGAANVLETPAPKARLAHTPDPMPPSVPPEIAGKMVGATGFEPATLRPPV
jgi:integrase